MKKTRSKETLINHCEYVPPAGFKAYAEPVYRGSTAIFKSLDEIWLDSIFK